MGDPVEIRRPLVEIGDTVRALPSTSFADKHVLNVEADRLRADLRRIEGTELDAASAEWAERAGRKGTHSVHEGEQAGAAKIVSPGETGH